MSQGNGGSGKVVVLGLDGVPYSLLSRFADEGWMPNVAALRREGTLCAMTASIPEVSSTSWSTFMTAVNPGRHGIYGFMELRREDYSWRFPNFLDLRSKTLWERAGECGKKSIVINVPATYPARPLEGMLVSGFVALDLRKATYPERLFHYLNSSGYRLDVDATRAVNAIDEFTADITATLQKRIEAIMHLLEHESWDLFIATVTETDRLHHYLWAALDDPTHPQHCFVMQFYRDLDAFIGRLYAAVKPGTAFVMLSDHGFTSIRSEVNINAFLREKGYLDFDATAPQSFKNMLTSSRAFALDPSRIYLHLKGRYPAGSVALEDYDVLRNNLRQDILDIEHEGVKIIREVLFKEEIYKGPCFAEAPDLVLLPQEGYDLKGAINRNEIFGRSLLTGGHTRENALFYLNGPLVAGTPNIVDAGATVIGLLGVEGNDLDGRELAS